MGNCLEMPKQESVRHSHMQFPTNLGSEHGSPLQESPVTLPFNNFTVRPDGIEETDPKQVAGPSQVPLLEVETIRMNNSYMSGNTSQYSVGSRNTARGRYIKRYRNEEEKLIDMLQEREKLLNSAIRQGQQLRAKCSRYQEELENIKEANRLELNENQWKKRYYDMDKKYRDIKEEVDVMVARNRNGRDFLRQQQDAIDSLNIELQREKIERQRLLSSSLTSLQSAGFSDKKREKALLTQLQVDNSLLQNRAQELTQRNARAREYLSEIVAEKGEQDKLILKLKQQLLREREEKETLRSRLGLAAESPEANTQHSPMDGHDLYAKVNKNRSQASEVQSNSDNIRPVENERHFNVLSGVYNEVELLPLKHAEPGATGENQSVIQQTTAGRGDQDSPTQQRVYQPESAFDGKSIIELNAEAITEQINVNAEEIPRDEYFTEGGNPYGYEEGENGVENQFLHSEETLTKF